MPWSAGQNLELLDLELFFLFISQISSAIEAILTADSASRKQEVQAWDGEVRRVSKHAYSLQQLQNAVRIPPW